MNVDFVSLIVGGLSALFMLISGGDGKDKGPTDEVERLRAELIDARAEIIVLRRQLEDR